MRVEQSNKKRLEGGSMKKSSGEVVTYYLSPEELEQVRNKQKSDTTMKTIDVRLSGDGRRQGGRSDDICTS